MYDEVERRIYDDMHYMKFSYFFFHPLTSYSKYVIWIFFFLKKEKKRELRISPVSICR